MITIKRSIIILGDMALLCFLAFSPVQAQESNDRVLSPEQVETRQARIEERQQYRREHRDEIITKRREFRQEHPQAAQRVRDNRANRGDRVQRARRQHLANHRQ